jgi:tRNA 2-thiocytidine biosynthesis protein TtcA
MSHFRDRAVRRAVGQAIHHYGMIADGDRIAVGLSGGKDSLTLLWILHERLSRIPIHYSLEAIHIDLGFDGTAAPRIEAYCKEKGYSFRVEYTDYGIRSHSEENRENPCFLCARLRRKRLFELADELGCNKLALGHNKDDIIETLFLNMCYGGEISTMVPCQPFFKGRLVVIRPMAYVDEGAINRFAQDHEFPDFPNACPTAMTSKRYEINKMLNGLYKTNKKIKGNIFRSMSHVKPEYLLKPRTKKRHRTTGLSPVGMDLARILHDKYL